jgi:hypothetical protein
LKGTLERYRYETIDIAELLCDGNNVLAAEVRLFGVDRPVSEVHPATGGFLLQGPEWASVDTPAEWTALSDKSVRADRTDYIGNASNFLTHTEVIDAAGYPIGWHEVEYEDGAWSPAEDAGPAGALTAWGTVKPPRLFPRDIDALTEEPKQFVNTYVPAVGDAAAPGPGGGDAAAGRPDEGASDGPPVRYQSVQNPFAEADTGERTAGEWTVPAGSDGEIILDAGALTTGFPVLELSGGRGRTVEVVYGECVLFPASDSTKPAHIVDTSEGAMVKARRDDIVHGMVPGYRDTIKLDGASLVFEPFLWRTFWFIRILVRGDGEAVTLKNAWYRYHTYPTQLRANFESGDEYRRLWDMCWRTLRNCSHETFEDCPYYEQLHYLADARIEAITHMYLSGDTDYVKHSVGLYRDSTRPDGLVESRYPSAEPQIIPYFALLWILMVEDLWEFAGESEREFIGSCLHSADGVLWYFRRRLKKNGFVGSVDPWNMVDKAPQWPLGEPPSLSQGDSTYLTCLYILALNTAARLHRETGDPADAPRWEELAERLTATVRNAAWHDGEGLFLEGPGRYPPTADEPLSQHAQVMAVLSGVANEAQMRRIKERIVSDDSLIATKLMQSYYLARALERMDMYAEFHGSILNPWREMLGVGLTTCTEYWPGRSDCHAWSAWPAADFLSTVLGVRPGAPGFREILIKPQLQGLDQAAGSVPTPRGPVDVSWKKSGETVRLQAHAPKGTPTIVVMPSDTPDRRRRFEDGGEIVVSAIS